jgi:hypothetical protein
MGWSLLTGQGPDDCDYLGAREAWVFEHERLYYLTDRIPMGRCGTKDEIAAMAAFIVSPKILS